MKKIMPLLLVLAGIAFLVTAMYLWLEQSNQSVSGSLFRTVGTILSFLLGAGANIKGWMELLKKDEDKKDAHFINEGEYIMGDKNIYYPPSTPSIQSILHQLPSPPADFIGRETEIVTMLHKIKFNGINIYALQGMGGVGKTSLILKLANLLKDSYPDAQLFLDLRGTDNQSPLTSENAMEHIISSIKPDQQIPKDAEKLAALYRSVLHGKRAIMVWDNARDAEQVKPLLIDHSLTLITSREHFVLPGMDFIELKKLSEVDAKELIKRIAKHINSDDASQLAKLCDYLALAIRVSASTLAERRDMLPSVYLQRLKDAQTRLSLVNASLQLSYDLLDENLQMLFRRLSVFGKDFTIEDAQAIWRLDKIELTEEILGIFIRKSLLDYDIETRHYYFHDLIQLYSLTRLREKIEEYSTVFEIFKELCLYLGKKYVNFDGTHANELPRDLVRGRILEVRQRLMESYQYSLAMGVKDFELESVIKSIDMKLGIRWVSKAPYD